MSDIKLKAASGGGSISLKGPSSAGSDTDFLDTSGNINLLDNQKVKCGDSTDLQIYHSSSSGNNIYQGNSHQFWNAAGNEVLATFAADGKCELYYNGQKCLQTQPDGGVETMDGNFIIGAAGHGIQFDTANSGTDQLLDDYEEGSWTASLVSGGSGITTDYASYTRIGNAVHFWLSLSSLTSGNSNTFEFSFPHTIAQDGAFTVMYNSVDYSSIQRQLTGYLYSGQAKGRIYEQGDDTSWYPIRGEQMGNGSLILSGTYRV